MYKTVLNKKEHNKNEQDSLLLIKEPILTSKFTLTAHFLTPIFISYNDYCKIGFVNSYIGDAVYERDYDVSNNNLHVVLNLKKAILHPNVINASMMAHEYYQHSYMITDTHIIYVFTIPDKLFEIFKEGKYSMLPADSYSKLSDARRIVIKNPNFLEFMIADDYFDQGLVDLIIKNDAEFWSKPDLDKEKITTYDIFRI